MREALCLPMHDMQKTEDVQVHNTVCKLQLTVCLASGRPGYISYLCIMVLSVLVSYGIYRHGNMLRKCGHSSKRSCNF